jgi:HAD superfamily phosphoserine phosphatase-like hydrolase
MLSSITPEQLGMAVDSVFEEYKDQVYVYTRSFIENLKKNGYQLFAISGSQTEIVSRICDYYGFKSFAATLYEIADNKFTGNKQVPSLNKDIALKLLIEEYGLDLKDSIAVGDSKSDIPLLQMVERPIAFNPDDNLYRYSRQKGWKIVIERKDVIYELEVSNGSYVLV